MWRLRTLINQHCGLSASSLPVLRRKRGVWEALINSAAPSQRIFFARFLSANPPHSFGYASGLPPQSDRKIYANLTDFILSAIPLRPFIREMCARNVCVNCLRMLKTIVFACSRSASFPSRRRRRHIVGLKDKMDLAKRLFSYRKRIAFCCYGRFSCVHIVSMV